MMEKVTGYCLYRGTIFKLCNASSMSLVLTYKLQNLGWLYIQPLQSQKT